MSASRACEFLESQPSARPHFEGLRVTKPNSDQKLVLEILARRQNWTQSHCAAVKRRPLGNVHNLCWTCRQLLGGGRGGRQGWPLHPQAFRASASLGYRRLPATYQEQVAHHPQREGEKSTQI